MSVHTGALSPFVYWGQNLSTVSLTVDLMNVKNPMIDIKENSLSFMGNGIGAKGFNEYAFIIEFYASINPNESYYNINDRHVEFVIKKNENSSWPRLIQSPAKPVWIKVNFDKIHHEESDNDDTKEWMKEMKESQKSYRDLKDKDFGRGRKSVKRAEDFKKTYLFLYNMFQFVGFLYILIIFSIRYIKDGPYSLEGSYGAVGRVMKLLHGMQLLEIVHPMVGYTKGSPLMPSIQLFGRFFMIFIMIDSEPRLQTITSVFYLFAAYAFVEIIRYPYYMLHVFDVNIFFITWTRYTAWIILYPLGFLCEAAVMFNGIPLFEETNRYSLLLPNSLNVSFHLPTVLRIYLLIGFFPALYTMMSHMYVQRKKIIGSKSHTKKLK